MRSTPLIGLLAVLPTILAADPAPPANWPCCALSRPDTSADGSVLTADSFAQLLDDVCVFFLDGTYEPADIDKAPAKGSQRALCRDVPPRKEITDKVLNITVQCQTQAAQCNLGTPAPSEGNTPTNGDTAGTGAPANTGDNTQVVQDYLKKVITEATPDAYLHPYSYEDWMATSVAALVKAYPAFNAFCSFCGWKTDPYSATGYAWVEYNYPPALTVGSTVFHCGVFPNDKKFNLFTEGSGGNCWQYSFHPDTCTLRDNNIVCVPKT